MLAVPTSTKSQVQEVNSIKVWAAMYVPCWFMKCLTHCALSSYCIQNKTHCLSHFFLCFVFIFIQTWLLKFTSSGLSWPSVNGPARGTNWHTAGVVSTPCSSRQKEGVESWEMSLLLAPVLGQGLRLGFVNHSNGRWRLLVRVPFSRLLAQAGCLEEEVTVSMTQSLLESLGAFPSCL